MDRRTFVKTAVAGSAAAAFALYSFNLMKVARIPQLATIQLASPQVSGRISPDLTVPHLLRRAGFGASTSELQTYQSMGFDAAVDSLVNYQSIDNSKLDSVQPKIQLSYSGTRSGNELQSLATWFLNRMVQTAHPLEEKMTLFWHNHFATGYSKVENGYLMYKQNQFLRANALGNFKDILTGITADGAMLVWLDGNQNRNGNPNENYAREIMEVFSTGRGPYTEDDIKNSARAFTGYRIDSTGTGVFDPRLHDNGIKTFMGVTGNLGPKDIIDILVPHPATASNLAAELFSYLAYPNPNQDTITRLSRVYLDSGYSIKALVQAILTSPEFVSSQAYLSLVKSPAEYAATALRSLGATANLNAAVAGMNNMAQMLFNPPSVFGWPSGTGWVDTASVLERYNFPLMLQTTKENPASQLNQGVFAGSMSIPEIVQLLVAPLFPDGIPDEFMQVIYSSTSKLSDPVQKTKNAVRLAMASPFFNLN
ncbi:MAG: DUF1800 domain-containing protein [Nitrososphaerales archaeon]|nr:DUF1800 domain-containing protein [Nitrososphaerales archaeon]